MLQSSLLPLWAVHISDGILAPPLLVIGFAALAVMIAVGSWRVREEEIPLIALLTAAFFVATLIHVPLGPTSAHLLLNGLVGLLLGRRACLAIPVGLTLQAFMLGHGGQTAIGVNACLMLVPALLARPLYGIPQHAPLRVAANPMVGGFLVGFFGVFLTAGLTSLTLIFGGEENWSAVAALVLVAHLPVAVVEGVIAGFVCSFLQKVRPELLPETDQRAAESPPTPSPSLNGSSATIAPAETAPPAESSRH
jgi:cobalt/nickel transport system permease protein